MQETSMTALLRLLEEAPVVVDERPIAGFEKWSIPADLKGFAMGDDKHFPAGDAWLRLGFPGIASKAREYSHPRMQAIARVYDAMTDFVRRHAEEARRQNRAELAANLDALTQGAPQTFAQALQALYLLWRVRSVGMTASIGRLDQALYPIYCREKQAGTLTDERALELICALWEKLNGTASGDTLVNVMTGGRDAQGNDQSNELSVLMLRASRLVAKTEPHINARIHPGSSAAYLEELEALHQTGSGQGTMYFDENVIPKLIEAGLPPELAAKYTNDGCTEILIDGEGKIFFTYPEAVKALELTLLRGGVRILPGETVGRYWTHTETPRVWKSSSQPGFDSGAYEESYEALEAAYLRQYGYQLRRQFDKLMERKRGMDADPQTNALLNGTFMQVLETGLDAHEALPATVWMMFSGSLIGAADGLAALKKVVYEDRRYRMDEVLKALEDNFEGHEAIRQELLNAPKYGNNHPLPDGIARRLLEFFVNTLAEYSRECGTVIWPATIGFMFVQEALLTGATPDGRRWKDPIAEHLSPTPGQGKNGPTTMLASVASLEPDRAFGVGPVHLSLPQSTLREPQSGRQVLKAFRTFAEKNHINMLNIAGYDAELMRAAQREPEKHQDIIVRVWGYSARFVDLSPEMQEHVIARIL